jgi:hypothetical protein
MQSDEFEICLFDRSCPDFLKVLARGKELEIIHYIVSYLELKFTSEELCESVRVIDRMDYLSKLPNPTLIQFCETQAVAVAFGKVKGWFAVETQDATQCAEQKVKQKVKQKAKFQGFQRRSL